MEVAVLTPEQIEQLVQTAVQKAVSEIKPVHFPSIMNKAQLCVYLDKKTSTIERWMREGMPFRKEGNDFPEFYKKDIDNWISERFQQIESEVVQ